MCGEEKRWGGRGLRGGRGKEWMGRFLDDLRAFGLNAHQWTTAAQDEGECRKTAEQGAVSFSIIIRGGVFLHYNNSVTFVFVFVLFPFRILPSACSSPYSGRISPSFAAAAIYLFFIRHTSSGQSRVYRVTQLRTDGVLCRESADTGPVNLKVVPNGCCLGRSLWTN